MAVSLRDDGMTPPAKSEILPPPLTGEAGSAQYKSPLTGEMPRRGRGVRIRDELRCPCGDDWNPLVSKADIPRVVEKSVNSVSAFGVKSSVHFLLPEGNPLGGLLLSPPNQVAQPSAALLRYGCGIPLAGTCAGLRRGPRLGELMGCAILIYYLFYLISSFLLSPLTGEMPRRGRGVI